MHYAPVPLRPYPSQQTPQVAYAHLHPPARFHLGQIALLDLVEYLQPILLPLAQFDSLLSHRPSWP